MNNSISPSVMNILLLFLIPAFLMQGCGSGEMSSEAGHGAAHQLSVVDQQILMGTKSDTIDINIEKIYKSEREWKEQLTSTEYHILRKKGTEVPYINEYWDNMEEGIYYCKGCGLPLFHSKHKYKSGTGWPSFSAPVSEKVVEEREDNSYFMKRTEIVCARCGSHIGHVFDDGPEPTGLRYCMNSAALKFKNTNH